MIPFRPRDKQAIDKMTSDTGGKKSIYADKIRKYNLPGEECIVRGRILPGTWNESDPFGPVLNPEKAKDLDRMTKVPFFKVPIFSRIGPNNSKVISIFRLLGTKSAGPSANALYQTLGGRDPIHEALQAETKGMSFKEQKDAGIDAKFVCWFIPRSAPVTDMPVLLELSSAAHFKFMQELKETPDMNDFDNPSEEGNDVDLNIERTNMGKKGGNLISYVQTIGFTPTKKPRPAIADEEHAQRVVEYIFNNPIPKILRLLHCDELEDILGVSAVGGRKSEEEAEEESDDKPSWSKKTSKKPVVVEEAEEDLAVFEPASVPEKKAKPAAKVVEEEEEDDEPPAPPKKTMKSTGKPAPRPTDDDFDPPEPAEEEPPKKTKAKPKPVEVVEEDEEAPQPAPKKAKPAPISVEDDDDVPTPPAKEPQAKKKPTPVATKGAFDDDE